MRRKRLAMMGEGEGREAARARLAGGSDTLSYNYLLAERKPGGFQLCPTKL